MCNLYRTVAVFFLSAILFAAQANAQSELPWQLEDYPAGGSPLTNVVAGTLVAQGDLIIPTCSKLSPGTVQQVASGFSGISIAIANSASENAALIVDGLPQCWKHLDLTDSDTRIKLGTALALAARQLAELNLQYAQEMEIVVSMSEDAVMQTAYELARGQDNLGELIAQEGSDPSAPTMLPIVPIGGGGLPTTN
jgi:hypothetical protein